MSFSMLLNMSPYREIFFGIIAILFIACCVTVVKTVVKVGFGVAALIALLNAFGWDITDILNFFGG